MASPRGIPSRVLGHRRRNRRSAEPVGCHRRRQGREKKKKRKSNKKKHKGSKNKKKDRKQKRRQQRRKNRQDQGSDQGSTAGSGTICQEIFSTGLRNPFRIAFDPKDTPGPSSGFSSMTSAAEPGRRSTLAGRAQTTAGTFARGHARIGVSNIADSCSESVNSLSRCIAYSHATGCRTITGGAFVPDDAGLASAYDGIYLFADFICDTIFALRDESPGQVAGRIRLWDGCDALGIRPGR